MPFCAELLAAELALELLALELLDELAVLLVDFEELDELDELATLLLDMELDALLAELDEVDVGPIEHHALVG